MKFSIFIPVFNRKDELKRTLRALIPEKAEHEIFVVDMGSTDGSQEVAGEHDWVELVSSKESIRSKALNHAADQATGDAFLFLAPGSLPARGWSQALEDHFASGFDAGHFICREVDAFSGWAGNLRSLGMKLGHQMLGGPASLNGVAVSKAAFEKVSGFRQVPDFEWLAFSARLKQSDQKVKAIKHDVLTSPVAGSRQENAWYTLKEDLLAAWKYRKSENFDQTRVKRKASVAILFGYDAFGKSEADDYFKYAQQELLKISLEVMQSYNGVEKIYFIGGNESTRLIGQPSGVEIVGKPRTSVEKRFSELVEKFCTEKQEGLLLVKDNSMELSHKKLRELSEGPGEEPCIILPEKNSMEWAALWLEQPALDAIQDWELNPGIDAVKTHLKSKIIRQEEENPVKALKTDSDARSLYYAGILERQPA